MWNTLCILMCDGSCSRYATSDTLCVMGKGPYLLGANFLVPVARLRFFPSSHTSSPGWNVLSVLELVSDRCSMSWACFLASNMCFSRSTAIGLSSASARVMLIDGLIPINSSCGVFCAFSCFHELWANSAIGRYSAQLSCRPLTQFRRYCSTHAFILSDCPSVLGWNAVDKFWLIPVALAIALEKCDVNRGSLSEIILLGMPNQGRRCRVYSWATPAPPIS